MGRYPMLAKSRLFFFLQGRAYPQIPSVGHLVFGIASIWNIDSDVKLARGKIESVSVCIVFSEP